MVYTYTATHTHFKQASASWCSGIINALGALDSGSIPEEAHLFEKNVIPNQKHLNGFLLFNSKN